MMNKQPMLMTMELKNLVEGTDYEILSMDCMDMEEFESYVNPKMAYQRGFTMEQLAIVPDRIHPDSAFAVRYEENSAAPIDREHAKLCSFGVLKMLTGEFEGKEFMFPIVGMDEEELRIHLFAYGVLVHSYIDELILKKLTTDAHYRKYLELTLDHSYYDASNPYYYVIDLLVQWKSSLDWLTYEGWPCDPKFLFGDDSEFGN
jgi:hypothetical protein